MKKNQLTKRGSGDIKVSDAVKQAKTLVTFEVCIFWNRNVFVVFRLFLGNIWRLFNDLWTIWLCCFIFSSLFRSFFFAKGRIELFVFIKKKVFPWVTICALLNNIFELRADAFKYCYVYQRPFAQPAWNIGNQRDIFSIAKKLFFFFVQVVGIMLLIFWVQFQLWQIPHWLQCYHQFDNIFHLIQMLNIFSFLLSLK